MLRNCIFLVRIQNWSLACLSVKKHSLSNDKLELTHDIIERKKGMMIVLL